MLSIKRVSVFNYNRKDNVYRKNRHVFRVERDSNCYLSITDLSIKKRYNKLLFDHYRFPLTIALSVNYPFPKLSYALIDNPG